MVIGVTEEHRKQARWLVDQMHRNNGLAPLDVEKFWADQEAARRDPWSRDIPQMPMGIYLPGECAFDELGVEEDMWRYTNDEDWRLELHKAYNDKAEQIVGKRLAPEGRGDLSRVFPRTKGLEDIFEGRNEWHAGSWWLQQAAHDESELEALLDRVDKIDVRSFILPENWEKEKARLTALGVNTPRYRFQRGPVTFAASIYGVENLVLLIMTNPDLAARFRDTIIRVMLDIARVLDEEGGFTPETAPHGFMFNDDNCYLLTPDMYEFFGYPIIKAMHDRYCPGPKDWRFQHSDSAMGHLLPVLAKLRMNDVNFGPTLTVTEIREHLPDAVIRGQLAPFTLSRNEEENIVLEFLRDFEMSREHRGVVWTTAGSINNGSRLTGMRLIMSAIQHFGRY